MDDIDGLYSEDLELKGYWDSIRLGLDAQQFLREHPVGRLIAQRASSVLIEARKGLETVTPGDVGAIQELQLEARSARNVLTWIGDAVKEGSTSEKILQQREEVPHE